MSSLRCNASRSNNSKNPYNIPWFKYCFYELGFNFIRLRSRFGLGLGERLVSSRWNLVEPRAFPARVAAEWRVESHSSLGMGKKREFREPNTYTSAFYFSSSFLSTCLHVPASHARNTRATPTLFWSRHSSREERWPSMRILSVMG